MIIVFGKTPKNVLEKILKIIWFNLIAIHPRT
jgi:predicted fused transcriptional regulator/phosphomethylpyrimidine kinase